MSTEPELRGAADLRSNYNNPFSPVIPSDTVGAIVIGLLAIILLVALLRSHARYRKLLERLAETCTPAKA
jgi:hypothetical protein